jgi:chemotaxis protein methyltransferase CheR
MTPALSETHLGLLGEFVAGHLGLDFSKRSHDLERAVRAVVHGEHEGDVDAGDVDGYLEKLLCGGPKSSELEALVRYLTVSETYFFRDKRALDLLAERVLPELLKGRSPARELRIWSAGCSTGEEPYSIAMLMERTGMHFRHPAIEIVGTDVNDHSLRKASEGVYGEWSFRSTTPELKTTYFHEGPGGRWTILPSIKTRVKFRRANLIEESDSSFVGAANDVIFCRNVLMYFTPEAMRDTVRRFRDSLAPNGWLVVGPAETAHDLFPGLITVNLNGATLYRKPPAPLQFPVPVDLLGQARVLVPPLAATTPSPQSSVSDLGTVQPAYSGPCEDGLPATHDPKAEPKQKTDDPETALLLARTCANEGRLTEAIEWCERAIAANKMAAIAYYLKATILLEQGLEQEALNSLGQTLYADPGFVLGHFTLGNVAWQQGRVKESQKYFENALLLLARWGPEDTVPESDGLSVRMLREILRSKSSGLEEQALALATARGADR